MSTTPDEIPNLTADLEASWDEVEPPEENDDVQATSDTKDKSAADDTSGDGGADSKSDDDSTRRGDGADDTAVQGDNKLSPETIEAKVDDKPPVGLSPAAREAWKDTPEAVRKDISKREADYASGIEKHREGSARAAQMDQVLAPFQQYMQMNGGPAQALNTLLSTGAQLQMGSPQQKAEMVANIIQQYGVDIQTLDNHLVGKAPPADVQQSTDVQTAVKAAMEPYQQFMQSQVQGQQAMAQQQAQDVTQSIDQFSADPANEFYTDVRMDMADLLDMAANRRQPLSLKEAYDKACRMNPDIDKIVSTRALTASASDKRLASTSIAGNRGGDGGGAGDLNLHDQISDAWANAGRT